MLIWRDIHGRHRIYPSKKVSGKGCSTSGSSICKSKIRNNSIHSRSKEHLQNVVNSDPDTP